jgi:hypothetical protein
MGFEEPIRQSWYVEMKILPEMNIQVVENKLICQYFSWHRPHPV